MKISRTQIEQVMALYRANAPRPAAKKEKQKDEISVSFEARLVQDARDSLKDTPEIREEKVQELKQAISRGDYSVSSRELAERMLDQAALEKKLGPGRAD